MAFLRTLSLLALLALGFAARARAEGDRLAQAQREVEQQVKALLEGQLAPGEFLVYAVVRDPGAAAAAAAEPSGADAQLPFSPVRVAPGLLQDILQRTYGKEAAQELEVTVAITFDERIPEVKRTILAEALTQRFGFDAGKRKLEVRTAQLVSAPIGEAETLRLEKTRLESEQARLRLETEQARLEIQKKDLELTQLKAAAPAASTPAATPPQATPTPEKPEGAQPQGLPNQLQLSPTISIFKDFQLTAMALVLGFIIIVAILVGGSFFVKGLSPLSRAIEAIGSSIETVAKNGGGGTQVTTVTAGIESGGDDGPSRAEPGGAPAAAPSPVSETFFRDQEAFVKEVQAKVDILSREKSFSFYRTFAEMIESKAKLPLAAAILVALDRDTARQIVSDLSAEQIAALRGFLNAEGGLLKAKELKFQALSDFYGQIAMAEFQGSPLMELRDLSWLTKKSTPELARFLLELDEKERPVFLACLSPERVRRILEVPMEDAERALILRAVGAIPRVTEDEIKPVVAQIAQRAEARRGEGGKAVARPAVDGAKYIAAVASELVESDQRQLFDAIKDDKALVEDVRQHYIPFSYVRLLPKELLLEIFGDRSDQQIATILFDAAQEVRDAVVGCLQEIRAESVKDEIKVLDDDKFYKKRNQKASSRMQREISRYLQALYAEGLVSFDAKPELPVPPGRRGDFDAA